MNHKGRIDKLEKQIGGGNDDEVITIVLTWPEQEPIKPIVYRRGDPFPFTQIVAALQRGKYTGGPITTVRWPDEHTIEK